MRQIGLKELPRTAGALLPHRRPRADAELHRTAPGERQQDVLPGVLPAERIRIPPGTQNHLRDQRLQALQHGNLPRPLILSHHLADRLVILRQPPDQDVIILSQRRTAASRPTCHPEPTCHPCCQTHARQKCSCYLADLQ